MKKIFLLLLLFPLFAAADVYLPAIFSSNMVLQQQSNVTVWGWAQPGEKVTVSGSWQSETVSVVTNENAVWKIQRPSALRFTSFLFRMVCLQRISGRKVRHVAFHHLCNKNKWIRVFINANKKITKKI